jgi:hypothetical protein
MLPDPQTNGLGCGRPQTGCTTKNVDADETLVLSPEDELTPTEQFLEYPEKLVFLVGNNVIIFSH